MAAPNAAVELMRGSLERRPDKVAYLCEDETLSYRQLDQASHSFARLLAGRGITPGDRVVLALPDCFAFPIAFLGCLLTGAIAVAAGSAQRDEDLAHIVADSGARLLVSHREHASRQAAVGGDLGQLLCDDRGPMEEAAGRDAPPHQPGEGEFAYLLYSSGSTGRPKGIPHRHASLLLPCRLMGEGVLGLGGEDLIFSTSKLSFCYGLINSLSFPLHFGAGAILHPGKPEAAAVLELIRRHRPTVLFSVPTLYRQLALSCAGERLELPVRLCCSAGETLPPPLFREWRRLTGLELIDGIGASELSHHFICNPPGRAMAGSAGRVVPGYRVRLVDGRGHDVPPGEEGELLVAGATRAPHYWNLPEQTGNTMLADGFTRTGDIFLERDGYYFFRGRSDDLIKVDAQWVAPLLVEELLAGHPAVAECAVAAVSVAGLPRPGAFVVPVPGVAPGPELARELAGYARTRLPDHMRPARYRFLTELPRTSTGKIRRSSLREPPAERPSPATPDTTQPGQGEKDGYHPRTEKTADQGRDQ